MHRRELVIGHTVLGRPIEAVHFTPPEYVRPRPPALLFGAIHGDEAVTQLMLERLADELIERPPGRDTWIIPCLNVDGVLAGTRNNANDVDLNRNFATAGWGTARRPGYHPGAAPEDQPETQALVQLIERIAAERLIALHSTFRIPRRARSARSTVSSKSSRSSRSRSRTSMSTSRRGSTAGPRFGGRSICRTEAAPTE
ncbi:MAG: murein peptide amidase A [Deltaproteobacteria bacterium]|nr:MAG: murein peptide amidase A [Deltaproteobacteria bacterium]